MASRRFDMPAMFGPSLLPDISPVCGTTVAAISFETTRDAAAALLPRYFDLTETPLVSLTWIDYPHVEYLGGRGYRELVVALSAIFRDSSGEMRAGFSPVMWVDQVGALISGREYMGFAKLFGSFEMHREEDHCLLRCREYDSLLVEGEAYNLGLVSEEALAKINCSAAEVNAFGWKYIASDSGAPDADYPIVNVTRWNYVKAWSGQGKLYFGSPSAQAAPMSSRVIDTLSRLPILEYRRSFVAEGDVVIDRTGTRRLDAVSASGSVERR